MLKCWGGVVCYMNLWFEGELELNMKRLGRKGGGGVRGEESRGAFCSSNR